MTTTVNTENIQHTIDSVLDVWVGKNFAPGFQYNGRQFDAAGTTVQCDLMISVDDEYGAEAERALILDGLPATFDWIESLGLLDGSVNFTINELPV